MALPLWGVGTQYSNLLLETRPDCSHFLTSSSWDVVGVPGRLGSGPIKAGGKEAGRWVIVGDSGKFFHKCLVYVPWSNFPSFPLKEPG